jgi:hypothetical protein
MALLNANGRHLFQCQEIGWLLQNFLHHSGIILCVEPRKFATIFHYNLRMVPALHLLSWPINKNPICEILLKPFCLAAVRRERNGDQVLSKFDAQSLPMITVDRCPHSDGLQFYNPDTGTFVSSIDYTFQHHTTAGSRFGNKYQAGTFIYRLDETTTIYSPKFKLDEQVLVHSHSPPHLATVIGSPTYQKPDIYTVKFKDGSVAEYLTSEDLLELAPNSVTTKPSSLLPSWVKGRSTATLFLVDVSQPRHGRLYEEADGKW